MVLPGHSHLSETFAIGTAAGILLAVGIVHNRAMDQSVMPWAVASQTVPIVALAPMVVLNTVFGGYFGSRLMSNIREDKGYTYGIYSYLQNHRQQSAWVISTEAGRDVCEATIAEVYKEMELLRNETVDKEELLLVQNYMMGSILGDLDGPFQIINRWKNIILNGLDESYFYNQIDAIKSITASEIQDLANKYLVPDKFYELVVV